MSFCLSWPRPHRPGLIPLLNSGFCGRIMTAHIPAKRRSRIRSGRPELNQATAAGKQQQQETGSSFSRINTINSTTPSFFFSSFLPSPLLLMKWTGEKKEREHKNLLGLATQAKTGGGGALISEADSINCVLSSFSVLLFCQMAADTTTVGREMIFFALPFRASEGESRKATFVPNVIPFPNKN